MKRSVVQKHKWWIYFLCFALCMESVTVPVWAAETAMEMSSDSGEDSDGSSEPGADTVSGNELPPALEEDADDVETDAEEGTDDSEADAEEGTDDSEADVEEGADDSETDAEEGTDDEETNIEEDVDDTVSSVSGNTLSSVSENDIRSVSENSLDAVSANQQAMMREAAEAFARLLAEKDLMALLYHADSYEARREADPDSEKVAVLQSGQTLYIRGIEITEEDVWYEVQFFLNGAEGTGYVQNYYLAYSDEDWTFWEEKYLVPILSVGDGYGFTAYGMASCSMMPYAVDTSDINAFPGTYQSALRSLKEVHPNWTFVPMKTGLDFQTAVTNEMGDKSLIQNTTGNASKGWVGAACPSESGWYYATKPAVAYHMDPRNFLTENYIFQFEQLTFNGSYHTQAAVQSFLNGTFMKGILPDDTAKRTYAQAFFEIGKNRKLSPIHLASRVYQEQGKGNSGLISGTYPGYEGYYNFFNVGVNGASEAEKIVKGLTYARKQGWDTRYKSLEGGATTIGNNYILKYQDTIYLEKFNVDRNSPYGIYNHQYMQNIQAPGSESISTRRMYANAGSLNSAFVFKIPVYDNMSDEQYYPVLTLNKTSMTLDVNKEADCEEGQQLKLYADGVEVNPASASWKSSDPSVATVENGLVKIADPAKRKTGEAVITASWQEVEAVCKVKVVISLTEITLDKTEIKMRRPDTVVTDTTGLSPSELEENVASARLQVTYIPDDTTADRTITWTSSNTKVAKVQADPEDSSRAVVNATGKGEAVITAKASKAGGNPVKTAVCQVRVSAPIYRIELTNPNATDTDTVDRTSLLMGQSVNLAAEYWPKDTTSDTQITWSSSNEEVVTVTDGRVYAKGRGTAVVTAGVAGCEKGYTAQHTVEVESGSVTFMKNDGKTVLRQQDVLYGTTLPKEEFPVEEGVEGSLFIGWYTGENGTGRRFDETTVIYRQNLILYPYYEEQGKGFYVLPVGDQIYTGSAIKPAIQVYDSVAYNDGNGELIELVYNKDYTVSYKNNKKVNLEGQAAPQITVKGKGNYRGTETISFNIVPKALTDTDIVADNITAAYNGRTIKSAPTVWRGGKKLKKNTDYTVTYPQTGAGAYQTAGTYPIVITGKGGYSGRITVYETITRDVLMSKVSVAGIPRQTYRSELVDKEQGIGIMPDNLQVTYRKKPLTVSTDGGMTGDYTVSYQNNMAVGTATVTITAVAGSGFTGSKSVAYKIVGTSIANAKVEGLEAREYTGDEEDVKQTENLASGRCRLLLDDQVLTESTDGGVTGDYVVSYANLSRAGTAKIIFQGVNEYTGQLKKSYKITGCQINTPEGGVNPAISLQYYTQDAPDQLYEITDLSQITTPYVKGGSRPAVVLRYNGIELVQGKDFTVRYTNNKAVTQGEPGGQDENGTSGQVSGKIPGKIPHITVTGKGNFKGSIAGTFTITDGRMAQDNGKLTMTVRDVVFRNKENAYKTSVTLTDCDGKKLAAGKDYERNPAYTYAEDAYVEVKNSAADGKARAETGMEEDDRDVILKAAGSPVEAGDIPQAGTSIRVTVRGTGPYAGDKTAEMSAVYRIVRADISKAKVTVRAKEYLNGQPVILTEEDLRITASGSQEPLQYGTDYTIDSSTYRKNQNKGKAAVTIRGLGNYGGERKVTYTIGAKLLVWWKNLF